MKWITPDAEGYDDSRTLFNAMIDRRPAVIAQCADDREVAEALAHAAANRLPVAVRSGGHSVAGMSMVDDGLVIDVRPMKSITVDPEQRTVTVGAGVTWGEFDRSTQAHGLAATGGRVSTTGVSGFTLGGGSGWIERSFGLACDSLRSVDLVTASGESVTASRAENPELFWALHGGGGNFGVATSLSFDLHALGPIVLAGLLLWPADAASEVAAAFRDVLLTAPDALGGGLVFLHAPDEEFVPEDLRLRPAVAIAVVYAGPVEEGAAAIEPWRALRPPVDIVSPMPYADFQSMLDDAPGLFHYWSADYHDELSDAALEITSVWGADLPSLQSQLLIAPWGGQVAAADPGSSPLALRSSRWVTHPFATWEGPAGTDRSLAWTRGFRRAIAPHTNGGVYLNFIGNEGQDRVRAAFGDANYDRLARIKRDFDPDNVFQGNQNIVPAL